MLTHYPLFDFSIVETNAEVPVCGVRGAFRRNQEVPQEPLHIFLIVLIDLQDADSAADSLSLKRGSQRIGNSFTKAGKFGLVRITFQVERKVIVTHAKQRALVARVHLERVDYVSYQPLGVVKSVGQSQ